MQLAALHRWHWIVIALAVGLGIGLSQNAFDSGVGGIYVDDCLILTDQQQFENGLFQKYNGTPYFVNAAIHTHQVSDLHGSHKTVDVVTGSFWNGQFQEENGKQVGHYDVRAFVAQRPYKPVIGIAGPNDGAPVAEYPSVGEFLAAMHRVYGVNYRYAWWANHPVLTSMIGSLIVIGGIWPTLINLLTFGTFMRPAKAKGISLWNVRQPARPVRPAAVMSDAAPPGEAEDAGSTPDSAPAAAAEESAEEALARVLEGRPLELGPEPEPEAHEYTTKPDDYYPTERRDRRTL